MGKLWRTGQTLTADFSLNRRFVARGQLIFANLIDCVVFH